MLGLLQFGLKLIFSGSQVCNLGLFLLFILLSVCQKNLLVSNELIGGIKQVLSLICGCKLGFQLLDFRFQLLNFILQIDVDYPTFILLLGGVSILVIQVR